MQILVGVKVGKIEVEAQKMNVKHSYLQFKVKYDCSASGRLGVRTVLEEESY